MSLLPSTMRNTNTAMKPQECRPLGAEIGADHGHQRHDRRVFHEERRSLMADQHGGELAQHEPPTMPNGACLTRSRPGERPSENSPLPLATASTANVTIAPVASLNADSPITVCATRSRIRIWRKTGINVAGSVDAIAAPSSIATSEGEPEQVMRREAGDRRGDHDADGGEHREGDPDPLQHREPQRRSAVEQDVARAEQHQSGSARE